MPPYTLTTTIDIGADGQQGDRSYEGLNSGNTESVSDTVCMDDIGFLESWSFAWVRSFYVRSAPSQQANSTSNVDQVESRADVQTDLNLKIAFSDSCGANAETLQDHFRRDEDIHGQINASMFRACWSLCHTRLILATIAYLISVFMGVIAIMVFLLKVMHVTNLGWEEEHERRMEAYEMEDYETNETAIAILSVPSEKGRMYMRLNEYFSVGFVVLIVVMYAMRSICSAINLRTAIMLRNACAGAVFEGSLKSSLQNHVPSYQTMMFCTEDGDAIIELVQKGSLVVAQSLSILMCLLCGLFAVGIWVFWAMIGLSMIFLIAYLLSMASRQFYRKSHTFLHQKLAVADEYCHHDESSATNDMIGNREVFKNRFSAAVSGQFWALFRAESMRPSFSGSVTVAILVGCISFMFQHVEMNDFMYSSETEHLMAFAFLILYLVHTLVSECSDSLMALVKGMVVLDKVKTLLGRPKLTDHRQTPEGPSIQISLTDVTFKWEKPTKSVLDRDNEMDKIEKPSFSLHIINLELKKNTIIGITGEDGSGLTSTVLALLRHMPTSAGSICQIDSILYFPKIPYLLDNSSIRQNIVFGDKASFNEVLYQDAVATVQMHMNQNFDGTQMHRNELDLQWQQRINIARALYNESSNTILLESPLCSLDSNTEISDIFADVVNKLLHQGKTVIVVSQDDNILRHCQHIYLLDSGKIDEGTPYDKVKTKPLYKEIVRNHNTKREQSRNEYITNHLQTTLNISSEDLVDDEPTAVEALPSMFNPLETFYLVFLNLLNVIFQIGVPFSDVFFITRLTGSIIQWAILVTLIFLTVLVGMNMLIKHYVHRIARRFTKSLQRDIFENILNTTKTAVNESHMVASLNTLLESNFRAFQTRSATIYSYMMILTSMWGLFALELWWTIFLIIMLVQFIVLYYVFRHTVAKVGHVEAASRLKLFEYVHNDLDGRAVIQSFEQTRESRNKIFELIDHNSMTIYLNKSVTYFVHFVFTICQLVNLPIMMATLNHDKYKSDYSYTMALYLYFLITYHVYALLEARLEKIVADQRLVNAHNFKMVISRSSTDTSTLKYT